MTNRDLPATPPGKQKFPILQDVIVSKVELGRGSFGRVIEAEYACTPCAAKELHAVFREFTHPRELQSIKRKFLDECIVWSRVRHPNIVQFIGVFYSGNDDSGVPMIVMEKMQFSLSGYYELIKDKKELVDLRMKLSILQDVSMGLCYLHAQKIIHRDLTPNNVLLGADGCKAKITDLGMAKAMMEWNEGWSKRGLNKAVYQSKAPGTLDFMPPEALSDKPQYGLPLDVFSYGGVILYTITHQWPHPTANFYCYPDSSKKEFIKETKRREKYFQLMVGPFAELKPLAEDCLDDYQGNRPLISEVCRVVKNLISKHASGGSPGVLLSTTLPQVSYRYNYYNQLLYACNHLHGCYMHANIAI